MLRGIIVAHLVRHLDDLVVALLQGLGAELLPVLLRVEGVRRLQRDVDVAALDGEVEARLLVGDEVEGDLREALLLEVGDDRVAAELRLLHDADHAVELVAVERELERALRDVDDDLAHLPLAVERVERAVRRRRQVDRHVERADDAVVAVGEQVLDVVERAEDEDVVAVPRA